MKMWIIPYLMTGTTLWSLLTVNGQTFPKSFQFGCSSAAYQVEGAWDIDGKGESIWDRFTHSRPDAVLGRQNGDVAADSYNQYKDDVQLLKSAGMQFYRFSISWSRVLPNGDTSFLNEPGLQYYDNLIDELLANRIEPMVTMYHWDLPQPLQEIGGMTNPEIVWYFEQYADVLFARYGDRVKTWITFDEPMSICNLGYGKSNQAPLVDSPGVGNYLCAHHILLANAKMYDIYRQKYSKYGGQVGISVNCLYFYPQDARNGTHVEAADRAQQFYCGQYLHPIFSKDGGYPKLMKEYIDSRSKREGRRWSRLPTMSEDEISLIKGKADFVGLNYFTSRIVTPASQPNYEPDFVNDQEVDLSVDPAWPRAKSLWLYSDPMGLRKTLNWIRSEYNNPEVKITKNGWSDNGEIQDTGRVDYMKLHLRSTLAAIIDGCKVTAHATWSIVDSFEWTQGYSERFGIYHVNFDDPERKRTPKDSVAVLRRIIQTRLVPRRL